MALNPIQRRRQRWRHYKRTPRRFRAILLSRALAERGLWRVAQRKRVSIYRACLAGDHVQCIGRLVGRSLKPCACRCHVEGSGMCDFLRSGAAARAERNREESHNRIREGRKRASPFYREPRPPPSTRNSEGLTDATMEALGRLSTFIDLTTPSHVAKRDRHRYRQRRKGLRLAYLQRVGVCHRCWESNPRIDGDEWFCGACLQMFRRALLDKRWKRPNGAVVVASKK